MENQSLQFITSTFRAAVNILSGVIDNPIEAFERHVKHRGATSSAIVLISGIELYS